MNAAVISLQGSAEPHLERLVELGARPRAVRQRRDLEGVTHLILPGGESTTIDHLLRLFELRDLLVERIQTGEICAFGTCAGAILLGRGDGERPRRMELLDVVVRRNAYGRQIDSFSTEIELGAPFRSPFHAVFIRAPRFESIGPDVEVLGRRGDEPVLVRQGPLLATAFHPELTSDTRIHEHFLSMTPCSLTGAQACS